ncbi:hypothetical protein [Gluconacetobacter johannae]|uniref:Uncharacterized protein n=1 Tax=Gluconacetobacter johannae TaxID=112140 RepID=A0A7W4J669_9PROT|nr:hypothetical protein [Gluconacetobacter johannae]MBB2175460.1 hypothetical protein [Gluconacetobacter johannae]
MQIYFIDAIRFITNINFLKLQIKSYSRMVAIMNPLDCREMITAEISSPASAAFQDQASIPPNAPPPAGAGAIAGHPALFIFAADVLSFIISFLRHPFHVCRISASAARRSPFSTRLASPSRAIGRPGRDAFWDETRIACPPQSPPHGRQICITPLSRTGRRAHEYLCQRPFHDPAPQRRAAFRP